MAAPPGDDPRLYSPSKLTALPDTYLTPSNDSLNNSGAYTQAIQGPIIASGHGPPARRDGQAFWDDTAPTPLPILISSDTSSPAAGRSPQDSLMGSPESEEPTLPALLTTQVGPATQLAIQAALPSADSSDSQQLWANMPSIPPNLPPQPEVIKVHGRTSPTSNKTPRARSRALSNASVWSHATVESNISEEAAPSITNPPSSNNLTFKWHTLAAAIRAGLLSDPMDPNAISMSGYDPDGDEDEFLEDLNKTLDAEIRQDISSVLQGWRPRAALRKGHELPSTKNEFNCMINCVLTALDAGAASHDGETMVKAMTPQSWMRLTTALLAAILHGALRSPAPLRSGSRLLSGIDAFPLHKDLDRPLTEGGAILLMCQQLGGLYNTNRNHPDKTYPDSYFDRLTTLLDSHMHQVPLSAAPSEPAPLTEVDRAQIFMSGIKDAVKAEIFANLNAEALENAEEWRALYKHEFVEAMHTAFETQYLGIHPNKGKARAVPPLTHSQVVRDAQPRIQQEVQLQVEARIAGIHQEIKDSLAANDPFWGQGPLRESIAQEIRNNTEAQVRQELGEEIEALKVTAQDQLDALKAQIQFDYDRAHEELHAQAKREYEEAKSLFTTNLEKDVQEFKDTIATNVKDWKTVYHKARNLTALRREARRFGCNVVLADEGSSTAEKALFKNYMLTPLEVDGRDISAEPPTPQETPFSTPPNIPNALPNPNVTPTPVRTKCSRTTEPALYPKVHDSLFLPPSSPTPTPLAVSIPLPSPMEEDLDYALEVLTDRLHEMGLGIHASAHAPSSGTNQLSSVHNPSATPQGAPHDAQSGGQPMAPIPASLMEPRSTLEEPANVSHTPADPLAAILAAINATISGLENRLTVHLDAQDKRIEALLTLTRPPQPTPAVKGAQAKGKGAVAAPPRPNTSSAPPSMNETLRPVPRVDDPVPQDRPEEIYTPGTAPAAPAQTKDPRPTVLREAFQPPPDKVVHLNVDSRSMPPSWANIMKVGVQQQQRSSDQAKAVTGGTFRSTAGKARPETVQRRKQSGNMEVTVICHHGLDNATLESTIRKMAPSSIIAETRTKVDCLMGGRVTLLSGRWSSNKTNHNFVYTFKGQLPFKSIYPLRDVLVKPLMTGQLVPNDGWTFAQIRDTTTSDHTGTVYTGAQIKEELRRNTAFEDAIFCIAPHWQGSIHKVSHNAQGTIKFAYVDEDGQITARAKKDSVFLFSEKTCFVPTGDVAIIQLCGRCHRIGHATDSAACPLPSNAVRCFICGGAHHSNDHATHCPRPHDKVGECCCLIPCINCGGGHNAHSPFCKLKMGFSPPPLAPPPATVQATPPKPSAKGKGPAPPWTNASPSANALAQDDLIPTQREPALAAQTEAPFTMVQRKAKRKANAKAKTRAANQSVPGSTSYAPSAAPQTALTPRPSGKLTSVVPARPAYKGKAKASSYSSPPSWHDAPVIFKKHVATDMECASAMELLFGHEPTPDELQSLHVAWGGHESDEEITALWMLHFRWAVKYGLPLTVAQTINKITGCDADNTTKRLLRFEEDWGPATPRNFLLSTIPRDQYFSHPGDLEENIISPEDAAQNRQMARLLIQSCIKFKTLEARANNEAPPPAITEPIVEAVLDLYSHNQTYSFFSLAKVATEDNDIWKAILDVHASATSALVQYA
ncbi:hypothetical protein EDB86DRAFT_3070738 [Lactarius hatsudake]|nr:hypothetical protein EDB86DRAFT_3070738 [Lactarius hatsudake]